MEVKCHLSGFLESVGRYCNATKQSALSVIFSLQEFRKNTELCYLSCKISAACLDLIMMRYPVAAYLAKLNFTLKSAASMHDFYRILKDLYPWFFPINAHAIDERAVKKDLANFLQTQRLGQTQEQICRIAQECIEAQLKEMDKHNDAYRNLQEFRSKLQGYLQNYRMADNTLPFANIDLSNLNEDNRNYDVAKWMRHVSLIERIMALDWVAVNITTIAFTFREWGLLDTAKWADRIGQYPAFQWVRNAHLGTCLIGLVFTGFAWKFFESARKLHDEPLTPQAKSNARWALATSSVQLIFFGSIFLNQLGKTAFNHTYLSWLSIVANSLGLLSHVAPRPKHQFF
jgi:hypothetical protein